MKIVILGTSNSVMGEKGYVKALRQRHDVTNLSTGRVGVAFHINRLLEHRDMIEAADVLIVDHYINDMLRFGKHLGAQYVADLKIFFDMLRCLNTHVINFLFPFLPKESLDTSFYDIAAKGMLDRNLCLIDLNKINFDKTHYMDELHLNTGSSYMLGMILAREITRLETMQKPSGGAIHATPFQRHRMTDLAPAAPHLNHKNRLMSFDYAVLTNAIDLPFADEESIYSIGYFTPKNRVSHQGVLIGSDKIGLACEPGTYFHENIETTTKGPLRLQPILGDSMVVNSAMGRGVLKGTFEAPFLVDLTTRRHDITFSGTPSRGPVLDVDMSGLLDALDYGVATLLKPYVVDLIRDLALEEEARDIVKAQALMQVAAKFRPDGPVIQQKLKDYSDQIGAGPKSKRPRIVKKLLEKFNI